jgi:5-formyltetrahydrofolate cyclo-ligase
VNKEILRETMLAARLSLDKVTVRAASQTITEIFLDKWGHCESFLLYSPIKNEIDTAYIAEALWKAKKTVLYPRVDGDMLLLGVCRSAADLQIGRWGILEPRELFDSSNHMHIDVAVIPGVAFDKANHRLGYGKGYYDRFLATAHIGLSVGVAYKWQLVETVFPDEHDQAVNIVVV